MVLKGAQSIQESHSCGKLDEEGADYDKSRMIFARDVYWAGVDGGCPLGRRR